MKHRGRVHSKVSERAWLRLYRNEALTVQNGLCSYCKCPLLAKTVTGDHVVSRKRGGATSKQNIVASCYECNQAKGAMSESEFKRIIKHPPSGGHIELWMAWSRRKMFVRTERACKRISSLVA